MYIYVYIYMNFNSILARAFEIPFKSRGWSSQSCALALDDPWGGMVNPSRPNHPPENPNSCSGWITLSSKTWTHRGHKLS